MDSIAQHQYPEIVWRKGEKKLWNPIRRKALKNRPEERVRLRIIEYLLQSGWSKHRISTEETLKSDRKKKMRTDVICYNRDFDPKILVECKAEHVALSSKTAEQVARYNYKIWAPYLLMSNGLRDYWYQISQKEQTVTPLGDLPGIIDSTEPRDPDYRYWANRGFAGTKAVPELKNWLNPLLRYYHGGSPGIQYLQFEKSPSGLDLNNYYHIFTTDIPETHLALGFLATRFGESRIIGILNSEGENRAVAEIDLDLLFEDERPNTSVYSNRGVQNIDISTAGKEPVTCGDLWELSALLTALFDDCEVPKRNG